MEGTIFLQHQLKKKYAGHCLSKSNNRGTDCQNTRNFLTSKVSPVSRFARQRQSENENTALTSKFKYKNTLQVTLKWNAHLKRAYSLIKEQLWSVGMKVIRRNRASSRLQVQRMEGIISQKLEKNSLRHRKGQNGIQGNKMKIKNTTDTPKP